jgi:hypothetical protein
MARARELKSGIVAHDFTREERARGGGGGARLFDDLGDQKPTLREIQAIEAPGARRSAMRSDDR